MFPNDPLKQRRALSFVSRSTEGIRTTNDPSDGASDINTNLDISQGLIGLPSRDNLDHRSYEPTLSPPSKLATPLSSPSEQRSSTHYTSRLEVAAPAATLPAPSKRTGLS